MKLRHLVSFLCLALAGSSSLRAQFGSPEEMAAQARIDSVLEEIQAKVGKGPVTAEALAPEFKELDGYVVEFVDHPEQAAHFKFVKAMMYVEAIGDLKQARELFLAVKRDYPKATWTGEADKMLVFLDRTERQKAAYADLSPVVEQISTKARAGAATPEAYAAEIAKLDSLVGKYAKNAEAAGHIALYKVTIYGQILHDTARARELLLALVSKYPDTLAAEMAQKILAELPAGAEVK